MTEPVAENGSEPPPVEGGRHHTSGKATSEEATATTTPVTSETSPEEEKDETQQEKPEKEENKAETTDTEKKESSNTTESKDTEASTITTATEEKPSESSSPAEQEKATTDKKAEETTTDEKEKKPENTSLSVGPVVSASKRTRPPYKYDPDKVTLRFLFANRDGLTVTVECKPGDTVGEVKGQLMSVWPEGKNTIHSMRFFAMLYLDTQPITHPCFMFLFDLMIILIDLPDCTGGDQLRLICMGKGMLMPDTRTLEDCQVPVFKTHPTPINVSVRPTSFSPETTKSGKDGGIRGASSMVSASGRTSEQTGQGCECIIL